MTPDSFISFQRSLPSLDRSPTGLEHVSRGLLLGEGWGNAVNRPALLGVDSAEVVQRLTLDIEQAAQSLPSYGDGYGRAGIYRFGSAFDAVGR
jgi:hypothetical protein